MQRIPGGVGWLTFLRSLCPNLQKIVAFFFPLSLPLPFFLWGSVLPPYTRAGIGGFWGAVAFVPPP